MSEGRFIGIDVGGTKVATAVLDGGRFETFEPVPTELAHMIKENISK